ncbi:MAG TPA: DUF2905 domain-containing protein [Abditibacteriaceae bacterium]|nr:DUF2905 domain-containing protein [Abditibacteriaceae bacterium]
MFPPIAKVLLAAGATLLVAGLAVAVLSRFNLPFRPGALPGDLSFRRGNWSFAFPIATCIVLSIVLTIVVNVLSRFLK